MSGDGLRLSTARPKNSDGNGLELKKQRTGPDRVQGEIIVSSSIKSESVNVLEPAHPITKDLKGTDEKRTSGEAA